MASPNLTQLEKGRSVVVWTQSTTSTVLTSLGRSLVAERIQLLAPTAKKKP
jgi:hypothetical protein